MLITHYTCILRYISSISSTFSLQVKLLEQVLELADLMGRRRIRSLFSLFCVRGMNVTTILLYTLYLLFTVIDINKKNNENWVGMVYLNKK